MAFHQFAGFVLSGAIGLSLGFIGGGGSIITVPVLVYVMGIEAHQAVAMSLAIVGVTSVIGTALHYRHGTVVLKAGALFGGSGTIGAYFGSRLTYLVSPAVLLLTFAGLMLFIAIVMLLQDRSDIDIQTATTSPLKILVAGLSVGVLTGFLGVGGGFLIVPALVLFGGLRMKDAVGTSLLAISINCAAALAGHLSHGGFSVVTASLVALFAVAGMFAGTTLSKKTSAVALQHGFAIFVIAVAVFLIAKNYAAILG